MKTSACLRRFGRQAARVCGTAPTSASAGVVVRMDRASRPARPAVVTAFRRNMLETVREMQTPRRLSCRSRGVCHGSAPFGGGGGGGGSVPSTVRLEERHVCLAPPRVPPTSLLPARSPSSLALCVNLCSNSSHLPVPPGRSPVRIARACAQLRALLVRCVALCCSAGVLGDRHGCMSWPRADNPARY